MGWIPKNYDYYQEVACDECDAVTEVRGTNIQHDGDDASCELNYTCECGHRYEEVVCINEHLDDYIEGNYIRMDI